ncbi:hypothetical protein C8F04DRAFT_1189715 [Mycena alexandri]|uniref:Uncharacterized protein n=1 Tax=Mycena alexandri TaxID=1745969 RepID=A0AAD6SJJ8_9AGAR|nr:hypothetical protein C8F04DRAFT_1189715 [Mycena alexandri]
MSYNPANPEASSVYVLYLVAAVGPPPQKFLDTILEYCKPFGQKHLLQMHTNRRLKNKPGSVGRYNIFCKPTGLGKCRPDWSPLLDPVFAEALAQGMREFLPNISKAQATILGTAARDAWLRTRNLVAGDDGIQDVQDVPAPKRAHVPKPRKSNAVPAKDLGNGPLAANASKPKHSDKTSDADELPEYDDYSPLVYNTSGVPARTTRIIVFDKPNSKPKTSLVLLRQPGRFELSFFKIAAQMQITHPEPNTVTYDRYCVFTQQWEPEDLNPINMSGRGDYMLYRASAMLEDSCLEIAELKIKVQDSADSEVVNDDQSEDSDDDYINVSSDSDSDSDIRAVIIISDDEASEPVSSQPTSVPSSQSTSSLAPYGGRKRKREFEEGSSTLQATLKISHSEWDVPAFEWEVGSPSKWDVPLRRRRRNFLMNVTLDSPSDSLFGLRSDNQKGYIGTICGPFWPGVGSFESLSGGRSVGMGDQLDENCSSGGIRAPIGLGVGSLEPHTSGLPLGTILGVSEYFHFLPNFGTQHRNHSSGGIRAPIGLGVGSLEPHTSGLPLGTILGRGHTSTDWAGSGPTRTAYLRATTGFDIRGIYTLLLFGPQHRNGCSRGVHPPIGPPSTEIAVAGAYIHQLRRGATAGYLIKGI